MRTSSSSAAAATSPTSPSPLAEDATATANAGGIRPALSSVLSASASQLASSSYFLVASAESDEAEDLLAGASVPISARRYDPGASPPSPSPSPSLRLPPPPQNLLMADASAVAGEHYSSSLIPTISEDDFAGFELPPLPPSPLPMMPSPMPASLPRSLGPHSGVSAAGSPRSKAFATPTNSPQRIAPLSSPALLPASLSPRSPGRYSREAEFAFMPPDHHLYHPGVFTPLPNVAEGDDEDETAFAAPETNGDSPVAADLHSSSDDYEFGTFAEQTSPAMSLPYPSLGGAYTLNLHGSEEGDRHLENALESLLSEFSEDGTAAISVARLPEVISALGSGPDPILCFEDDLPMIEAAATRVFQPAPDEMISASELKQVLCKMLRRTGSTPFSHSPASHSPLGVAPWPKGSPSRAFRHSPGRHDRRDHSSFSSPNFNDNSITAHNFTSTPRSPSPDGRLFFNHIHDLDVSPSVGPRTPRAQPNPSPSRGNSTSASAASLTSDSEDLAATSSSDSNIELSSEMITIPSIRPPVHNPGHSPVAPPARSDSPVSIDTVPYREYPASLRSRRTSSFGRQRTTPVLSNSTPRITAAHSRSRRLSHRGGGTGSQIPVPSPTASRHGSFSASTPSRLRHTIDIGRSSSLGATDTDSVNDESSGGGGGSSSGSRSRGSGDRIMDFPGNTPRLEHEEIQFASSSDDASDLQDAGSDVFFTPKTSLRTGLLIQGPGDYVPSPDVARRRLFEDYLRNADSENMSEDDVTGSMQEWNRRLNERERQLENRKRLFDQQLVELQEEKETLAAELKEKKRTIAEHRNTERHQKTRIRELEFNENVLLDEIKKAAVTNKERLNKQYEIEAALRSDLADKDNDITERDREIFAIRAALSTCERKLKESQDLKTKLELAIQKFELQVKFTETKVSDLQQENLVLRTSLGHLQSESSSSPGSPEPDNHAKSLQMELTDSACQSDLALDKVNAGPTVADAASQTDGPGLSTEEEAEEADVITTMIPCAAESEFGYPHDKSLESLEILLRPAANAHVRAGKPPDVSDASTQASMPEPSTAEMSVQAGAEHAACGVQTDRPSLMDVAQAVRLDIPPSAAAHASVQTTAPSASEQQGTQTDAAPAPAPAVATASCPTQTDSVADASPRELVDMIHTEVQTADSHSYIAGLEEEGKVLRERCAALEQETEETDRIEHWISRLQDNLTSLEATKDILRKDVDEVQAATMKNRQALIIQKHYEAEVSRWIDEIRVEHDDVRDAVGRVQMDLEAHAVLSAKALEVVERTATAATRMVPNGDSTPSEADEMSGTLSFSPSRAKPGDFILPDSWSSAGDGDASLDAPPERDSLVLPPRQREQGRQRTTAAGFCARAARLTVAIAAAGLLAAVATAAVAPAARRWAAADAPWALGSEPPLRPGGVGGARDRASAALGSVVGALEAVGGAVLGRLGATTPSDISGDGGGGMVAAAAGDCAVAWPAAMLYGGGAPPECLAGVDGADEGGDSQFAWLWSLVPLSPSSSATAAQTLSRRARPQ